MVLGREDQCGNVSQNTNRLLPLFRKQKKEAVSKQLVRSSVGSKLSEWCALPAIGTQ